MSRLNNSGTDLFFGKTDSLDMDLITSQYWFEILYLTFLSENKKLKYQQMD